VDLNKQLANLKSWFNSSVQEKILHLSIHEEAFKKNGEPGYGPVEAEVLFAYVASRQPAQIFQIGCGVSTAVCLLAAEFAGYKPAITCVEPYPTQFLREMGAQGKVRLIREKAQNLRMSELENLDPGAFFFVDSTHSLGPAGEVSKIILEMLPILKKGSHAHFHDILFPFDYARDILTSALFFPHESTLLHGFLCGNARFRILCSLSMLHYGRQEELRKLLPRYEPAGDLDGLETKPGHFPSSTYLEVFA